MKKELLNAIQYQIQGNDIIIVYGIGKSDEVEYNKWRNVIANMKQVNKITGKIKNSFFNLSSCFDHSDQSNYAMVIDTILGELVIYQMDNEDVHRTLIHELSKIYKLENIKIIQNSI